MHDHRPFDDDEESWSTGPSRSDAAESTHYRPGSGPIYPCPQCQSLRTEPRHVARRIGGTVGAAAGATGAVAIALSGAEAGATAGLIAGPIGSACGGVAGAILAGLIAGAAGCATGAAFGEAVDQKILDNWRCLACGRTFSVQPR
ncbi:hypothetical protein [Burkholderia sp. lyk4-R2A-23]|uniref:hypothetical protein n=1 Tax=Burkholderia sp. lyk4-R2A-23 TaxID=3040284 RepID=UPI0025505B63|nr:hypothetical protein [Burkholderia sp. lyk4-R2A-23]